MLEICFTRTSIQHLALTNLHWEKISTKVTNTYTMGTNERLKSKFFSWNGINSYFYEKRKFQENIHFFCNVIINEFRIWMYPSTLIRTKESKREEIIHDYRQKKTRAWLRSRRSKGRFRSALKSRDWAGCFAITALINKRASPRRITTGRKAVVRARCAHLIREIKWKYLWAIYTRPILRAACFTAKANRLRKRERAPSSLARGVLHRDVDFVAN